ncbi:hypothetical protein TrRE_jg166 [Triparma retinervis]|uniref:AB hydrolase-1 domain-containing protein n=1 Tax=Triparma retinervis TaxID=2557542 RepID=A0A9W7DKM2_9STRA|nr:hypothetical protein TrRE_jg166 [Triparma retinervis]
MVGKERNFWNLDLPGHGLSDHKSFDSPHVMVDYMFYVKEMVDHIMTKTGAKKVSLIGHSMGSGVASAFASVFPELVSDLVMIEGIGPLGRPSSDIGKHIRQNVEKRVSGNPLLAGGRERMYKDIDEAVKVRMRSASLAPGDQYISEESARLIVERALKEGESGGVYFAHDKRLQWPSAQYFTEEQVRELLGGIECRTLIIKAEDGWPNPNEEFARGRMEAFKEGLLEVKVVKEGSHHCHMDERSRVEVGKGIIEWLEGVDGRMK